MGVQFPKMPGSGPATRPLRFEASIHDCEVEGTIPSEIRGSFYRACIDRRFPPRFPNDAVFNEDGAADMFRFENGHVDFKSRYVRTERFLAEREAHEALFGLYRNKYTSDPSVRELSHNTANTTPIVHAGRLFMLKESDPPMEMDPHTLETRGPWDFGGKLTSRTFTAHPKIDTATGEMIAFGYEAKGDGTKDVAVFWMNAAGEITRELWFKAPVISMMHDMALTDRHIIIPTSSYRSSLERLKDGKLHWGNDPGAPTWVAILPRDAESAEDVRWFKGPGDQMVHTINAVSEGDKVILDAPVSAGNPFPWIPNVDGSPFDPQAAIMTIRRWTFDLDSDTESWEEADLFPDQGTGSGLARMDDRYMGHPHRYSFMGYTDRSKPFDTENAGNMAGRVTNMLAKFDHATGTVRACFPGDAYSLQEGCFVPRSQQAPEGDGYLLSVATNYRDNRSELLIADTAHMEDGPVARVLMPFRLHSQVHGWWASADDMPFA